MNGQMETPTVQVLESEYKRLLGFPPDYVLEERSAELAAWAVEWYTDHGKPWIYSREVDSIEMDDSLFRIDGVEIRCEKAKERFLASKIKGCVLVAASAGPEAEEEARQRWNDERPDEYYFLETFASAVVENLLTVHGAKLCEWADGEGWTVLPHYSPGYSEWELEDQGALFEALSRGEAKVLENCLQLLPSGMLQPRKSQLALFGLIEKQEGDNDSSKWVPCETCSFSPCQFRRAPYRWETGDHEAACGTTETESMSRPTLPAGRPPLSRNGQYTVNVRALEKWSRDRLELKFEPSGSVIARFRYEGSTCNDSGTPILMDYTVCLSPGEDHYRILKTDCAPAAEDSGYKRMCYWAEVEDMGKNGLQNEHSMLGKPLDEILQWKPDATPSGCLCRQSDRNHKWNIVFQTIHYGLVNHEESTSTRN